MASSPRQLASSEATATAASGRSGFPAKQGMYNPAFEKDACGLAMVATLRGEAGHDIVDLALTALRNLEHRGAIGSERIHGKGEVMTRTLMALAAAAAIAVSTVAVPAPAHAQRGVAAGVVGGLIGGAIIGGALAGPRYYGPAYYGPRYYGPGYGYYGPAHYGPRPYYGGAPGCYWARQRFWDGFAWRVRPYQVCN